MEYKSSNEFFKKLETDNYEIGSFDAFLKNINELISNNLDNIQKINTNTVRGETLYKILKSPFRASVIDKTTREFIGFISTYNIDNQHKVASLIFISSTDLEKDQINEILDEYKDFITNDLGISTYQDFTIINNEHYNNQHADINIPYINFQANYLKDNTDENIIDEYKAMGYNVPNLSFIKEIVDGNRKIGIIGLSNIIWSNNRANLNVFFNRDIDSKYIEELGPLVMDEYLDYIHKNNLHNVSLGVSGSNTNLLQSVQNSSMDFYAAIPFASQQGNKVDSNYLFQSYPNMTKKSLIQPKNELIIDDTKITRLDDVMELSDNFIAISPKVFEEYNIDLQKIVKGHINALQNRTNYSIPLGEDKYMLEEGNGKYGISKTISNYEYIILDRNFNYCGIAGIIRTNGKNAEIEVALAKERQHQGLGKIVTEELYKQLFKHGYQSATSAVFDFNNPSNKLINKIANYNGTRIESYYINGKLWDMHYYTRINGEIKSNKK